MTEDIPADYQPIEGSERLPALGARLVGPEDPTKMLLVTIRVRRRPDAPALPDQKDWATKPLGQRKFLSRDDFASQYGAAPSDLKLVTDFAESRGLKVMESNVARRTVVVSGTVKQMSSAFAVKLGVYKSDKETYRGREGHVHLPKNIANVVEGVFGLDNRKMARRTMATPGASTLTPPQVAKLYNFPTSDATGQTIGLLEFGGGYNVDMNGNPTDIQAFFKGLGLETPKLTPIGIDGQQNAPGSDADTEVVLDIDVSGSVAQGADIAVYFAPWTEQGWIDAVTTAIHPGKGQPAPSVLSISWGWPENYSADGLAWTRAVINAVSATFQEAAALGVTILVSSGDSGSDCQIGDGKAHVSYPASDPWVTACGGTIITNVSGSTFTEGTWNDSDDGATGGGISDIFPLPTWQSGAGVPPSANDGKHQGRGLPDVAGNASPHSGYNIQVGGVTNHGVGGTSEVAPLYAGLVALINANIGRPIGYLNPTLYAPGGTNVFRDINDGANNRWSGGPANTPSYTTGPGWDACTGWGSINGNALLMLLRQQANIQEIKPSTII